jgi:hypothetical protein
MHKVLGITPKILKWDCKVRSDDLDVSPEHDLFFPKQPN